MDIVLALGNHVTDSPAGNPEATTCNLSPVGQILFGDQRERRCSSGQCRIYPNPRALPGAKSVSSATQQKGLVPMTWWRFLMCRIFFHRLVVVRDFGIHRKVRCLRCGRAFGMHDGVKAFIPWDGELEEMCSRKGW